jgi:hypothetical protein
MTPQRLWLDAHMSISILSWLSRRSIFAGSVIHWVLHACHCARYTVTISPPNHRPNFPGISSHEFPLTMYDTYLSWHWGAIF